MFTVMNNFKHHHWIITNKVYNDMHSTLKTPSKHQQNLTHTFEFVENLLIDTLKKKKNDWGSLPWTTRKGRIQPQQRPKKEIIKRQNIKFPRTCTTLHSTHRHLPKRGYVSVTIRHLWYAWQVGLFHGYCLLVGVS